MYVAAPGDADTALVLNHLAPRRRERACHDLGSGVAVRLARWEREALLGAAGAPRPMLLWCPRAAEGTSLLAGLTLGRLAALLRPCRLTVLWFAAEAAAPPTDRMRRRADRLFAAAVPETTVSLHCVGWAGDAADELESLGRRFA